MGWNFLSRNESINRDAQRATLLNDPALAAVSGAPDYQAEIAAIHELSRLLITWCRPRYVVPLGAARVQRETLSRVAGIPQATSIISPPASIPITAGQHSAAGCHGRPDGRTPDPGSSLPVGRRAKERSLDPEANDAEADRGGGQPPGE